MESDSPSGLASDSDSVSGPDLAPDSDLVQDLAPESVPDSVTASGSAPAFGPARALTELSSVLEPSVPSPGQLLQFPLQPEFVVFAHARSRRL